jgi:hypothetical protein
MWEGYNAPHSLAHLSESASDDRIADQTPWHHRRGSAESAEQKGPALWNYHSEQRKNKSFSNIKHNIYLFIYLLYLNHQTKHIYLS